MYAQLCLRLNNTAPNFEDPTSQTTTFRRLLLSKCKEEFENRTRASTVLEKQDGAVSLEDEEEEQRSIAKRKILGNIKFTGELFKLGMLHESIIHQCIKELLEKRRNVSDMCDNIECVCNLMSTVGQKLDTPKARGWTDKYFSRMKTLSENKEFPPRIRFMLLDAIELRQNKWVPRKVKAEVSPQPLQRAHHTSPATSPNPSPLPARHSMPHHRAPPSSNSPYLSPHHVPPSICGSGPDTLSPSPSAELSEQPSSSEAGSAAPAPTGGTETRVVRKLPSGKSGRDVSLRPNAPARMFQRVKPAEPSTTQQQQQPAPPHAQSVSETQSRSSTNSSVVSDSHKSGNGKDASSYGRGQNLSVSQQPFRPSPPPASVRVAAPPPHGHMMPRPGHMITPMMPARPAGPYVTPYPRPLPPGGPPANVPPPGMPMYSHPGMVAPHVVPPMPHPPTGMMASGPVPELPTPSLHRSEAPPIKHVSKLGKKASPAVLGPSGGARKSGGHSKHEKIDQVIHQLLSTHDVVGVASAIKQASSVKTPPHQTATLLISRTLQLSEDERCEVSELIKRLHSDSYLDSRGFVKAVMSVLSSLTDTAADYPLSRNAVATFIARGVAQGVVPLQDALGTFVQGLHHPTSLIMLKALNNLIGQESLQSMYRESGFRMMSLFPASDQSLDTVSQQLESRNLMFLFPLKKVQRDLTAQLQQDGVSAATVYRWMKTEVDPSLYHTPEFIMLLTQCILKHVTQSSADVSSVKSSETEKLLEEFKVLVQKLVMENHSLQMMVLCATQVFCHDLNFPKGLVLRLFACWYDMDVVEEEAFMMWKDDLSRDFPGKEKALFQVNQWLSVLAEEDSEEEES